MDNIFQMIWWMVELAVFPLARSLLDIIVARDHPVTEKQILNPSLSSYVSSPLKYLNSRGRVSQTAEVATVTSLGVAPGGAHVQL